MKNCADVKTELKNPFLHTKVLIHCGNGVEILPSRAKRCSLFFDY